MNTTLPALLAALVLAACAPSPAPSASTTGPSPSVAARSLDEGLRAAGLVRINLEPVSSVPFSSVAELPKEAPGRVSITGESGFGAEPEILAKDASGRIYHVVRRPEERVKEKRVEGCRPAGLTGGHRQMVRLTFELPPGATWGGEVPVPYVVEREVVRYSDKTPDGKPCPLPDQVHD